MTVPRASVVGPGWVDHSVNEIAGLFPLSVERFFNAAVALHAPGVTTVTVGARYYALHSLVAHEKQRLNLSDEQARHQPTDSVQPLWQDRHPRLRALVPARRSSRNYGCIVVRLGCSE